MYEQTVNEKQVGQSKKLKPLPKVKSIPGVNASWNFKGMAPKHTTVIQARKELFRGGHGQYFGTQKPKANTQAPKGLQEVHLYVRVGGVNKKKAIPKGKSWEQRIVEF